jgi:hypothetical protein
MAAPKPAARQTINDWRFPHRAHRVPLAMFSPRGFPHVRHARTSGAAASLIAREYTTGQRLVVQKLPWLL